ncbi:MAG: phosphoribosyltransferase [Chloroflexi bacterium]|nr:phosphoribosyltransferase [Chloroflexota bacterium]
MNKQHLTWTQIEDLAIRLADRLPTDYDVMLVITRGGMVPACIISERLNLRNILVAAVMFYTSQERTLEKPIFLQFPADPLLNGRRVLVVDDVWDSGRTIMAVSERVRAAGGDPETAVLHYKPTRTAYSDVCPDYYVDDTDAWIVYPWDVGEANVSSGVLESLSEA